MVVVAIQSCAHDIVALVSGLIGERLVKWWVVEFPVLLISFGRFFGASLDLNCANLSGNVGWRHIKVGLDES